MHKSSSYLHFFLTAAIFSVLALLGNVISLPLFFGVDIIFGSILVFIATLLYGFRIGLVAVCISAAYTLKLWNHHYAFIIFVLEFLTVTQLIKKKRLNLVQADTLFWLLGGLPLVFFFYTRMIGLPFQAASLIMLKQGLNGIFNALVAYNLVMWLQYLAKEKKKKTTLQASLSEIYYGVLLLAVLVSNFVVAGFIGRKEFNRLEPSINKQISLVHELVRQKITSSLRSQANQPKKERAKQLQALLEDSTQSSKAQFFLFDQKNKVLASTFPQLMPGQTYKASNFFIFRVLPSGVSQIASQRLRGHATMKQWKNSRYQTQALPIAQTQYRLVATLPVRPYQVKLFNTYIQLLLITLAIGVFFVITGSQMVDVSTDLEQQVTDRTKQLQTALAKAESANITKDQFLMTISHELRTPMNAIIGFTNVMLKRGRNRLTEKDQLFLRKISDNGIHLLELINELLDFTKFEAGAINIELKVVELCELTDKVLQQLSELASGKKLTLQWESEEKELEAYSDPRLLRQILINLIGNAIKFTESGSITLKLIRRDPTYGVPAILVRDTGIGIKQEAIQGLFEPFVQADSSTTRKKEGTGLGLAICKSICQMLGHQIEVQSKFGEGSTFSIILTQNKEANQDHS